MTREHWTDLALIAFVVFMLLVVFPAGCTMKRDVNYIDETGILRIMDTYRVKP